MVLTKSGYVYTWGEQDAVIGSKVNLLPLLYVVEGLQEHNVKAVGIVLCWSIHLLPPLAKVKNCVSTIRITRM